jgi:hypothetical protein
MYRWFETIPLPDSLTLYEFFGCVIAKAGLEFAVLSIVFTGSSSIDCTSSAKKFALGNTPRA